MGVDKHPWLEFLIPSFRATAGKVRSLGQQVELLENTNRQLQEEVRKQVKSLEGLRQQVERRNGIMSKQQSVIEKLTKRVETIQLEKDQVYEQYNALLRHTLDGGESSTGGSHEMQGGDWGAEYVSTEIDGREWHLNIGCGNKKRMGSLNVDVDIAVKPDVVVSLGPSLPFTSDTFSLVEAFHVVEHVYPWISLDIFKEFWRILKPGGRLVVECPNIEAACAWLSHNSAYGPDSQMGMWAIYGDPNPKNPFHMHKWGYTPVTLAESIKEAGFVRIEREVPETHVPARDFRMTATKPVQ
jgi:predicted SAM-dependent methyltransferase